MSTMHTFRSRHSIIQLSNCYEEQKKCFSPTSFFFLKKWGTSHDCLNRYLLIITFIMQNAGAKLGQPSETPRNKIIHLRRLHQSFHSLPKFRMCRVFLQVVVSVLFVVKFFDENMSIPSLDAQNQPNSNKSLGCIAYCEVLDTNVFPGHLFGNIWLLGVCAHT